MSRADDFIQQHATDGTLTTEQAAQLLELAMGDTGAQPESSEAPAAAPEQQQPEPSGEQPQAQAADPDPADAVLMAKDGVHTIPYERLTEARQQAQQYKGQLEEKLTRMQDLEQELAAARAAAQQPASVEPKAPDVEQEADIKVLRRQLREAIYEGDDDKAEALEDQIDSLTAKRQVSIAEQRVADLRKEIESLQKHKQEDAAAAHFRSIYEKHPDADSIAESKELFEWINAQVNSVPSAVRADVRAGYERVLQSGSALEVVELLDAFKKDAGRTQPEAQADARAAARAAVAGIKPPVPASLSDIPGGTAGPSNKFETLASLAPADLSSAMAGMNAEQIEAFLNRNG